MRKHSWYSTWPFDNRDGRDQASEFKNSRTNGRLIHIERQ
jgi:hypothetical protein